MDLYADILGRLLEDRSGVHAQLRSAVDSGDPARVQAMAHSMKGLALMCGAVSVGDAAVALEGAAKEAMASGAEVADMQQLMSRLDAEMAAARIILAPYR